MSTPKQHSAAEDHELAVSVTGEGLPDPSGTRMVLISAGQFSELDPLPATRRSAKALADLLAHAWNLPAGNCTVLFDPASPRDLSRAVAEAAKEATDTLLVYYAGHGLIDFPSGKYHLAVQSTERESVRDTAVPYSWIKEHVEKSRAERRVIILDCCYAARAFGSQSGNAALGVAGTCILVAANETAEAISPPGEHFTAFTGALLTVLRNGVPGPSRHLDLDTVFEQLVKELALRNRPRPTQLCRDLLGRSPFIENAAYRPPGNIPKPTPPAQHARTAESNGSGEVPHVSPMPAPAKTGEASAETSAGKTASALRRKIVRCVGLSTAGLALLFGAWSAYAVSSISYEDSPQLQKIHRRGFIKVGVKGDQPGLSEQKGKEWVGFEVDLGRKIAASLGFTKKDEVRFVKVDTTSRDKDLQAGSGADFVVATWSMNGSQAAEGRADKISPLDFVGPYYVASVAALAWGTKEETETLKSINSIKDKYPKEAICTAAGSTSEDYLIDHGVKFETRNSYEACWTDSNIHVVITDDIILAGLNEKCDYAGGVECCPKEDDGTCPDDEAGDLIQKRSKGDIIPLHGRVEKYGVGIRANDPIFKYLTCRAIPNDWESSARDNLEEVATRQIGKDWTLPLVNFPKCSRLAVWSYKLRNAM
ncbi:transporter substrate-binding domain-containing protein [Streptomyces sp. NPDC002785]|uniref:caspase, EACC1-associated type n=1 Tax=Streptomyces sp. NPDC002785 TaxID=3154543 RepID=UPI003317CC4E